MRIFSSADLHLGVERQGDESVWRMARYLNRVGAQDDVLTLNGDLGTNDETINSCLTMFADFPGTKLVIPGNHDIWVTEKDPRGSLKRYRQFGIIARSHGFHPLHEQATVVSGVGLAGCMGWYDYSFADLKGINEEQYQTKTYPGDNGPGWNDASYVRWPMNDKQATAWQLDVLTRQLQQLSTAKHIVVCMHHLPTNELLAHPRQLVPRRWRFLNTFLGSNCFEQLLRQHTGQVRYVLCGHSHMSKKVSEHGIQYASIGSDYENKELVIVDKGRLLRKRFSSQ